MPALMSILQAVAVVLGVLGLAWVLSSAVKTVVVPRPERVLLTRLAFQSVRRPIMLLVRRSDDPRTRDRLLALIGPTGLLLLPVLWSIGATIAYAAIFWGLDAGSVRRSIELSGSALTTMGFVEAPTSATRLIAISEGLLGLGIVALIISFLPSLYGTFSRREIAVGRFVVRAGDPPSPAEFISRLIAIERLDDVGDRWEEWEDWFVELGETHTSFPALVFFRSARPSRSWLTVAEAALDTAALVTAADLAPPTGQADTMIRSGYLALRAIADFFGIEPEIDPASGGALSIDRSDFDRLLDQLDAGGCRVVADRDLAWQRFWGWRVNYDRAVCGLALLVGDVQSHWTLARERS